MPNGGLDNCGECWFNARNKGEVEMGHKHSHDKEEHYCIIRKLPITGDPFYTYCANHPYNTSSYPDVTPQRIEVPIGPVFQMNASVQTYGRDYTRIIWVPSPDSEQIRLKLLELLVTIEEQPVEYFGHMPWDDMVIWQLGEFREQRAVDDLKRIAAFNPERKAAPSRGSIGFRTRQKTVMLAHEALTKILNSG